MYPIVMYDKGASCTGWDCINCGCIVFDKVTRLWPDTVEALFKKVAA